MSKKKKAIDCFVAVFNGSYQKLDDNDVDYKIFNTDKKLIAYAEVRERVRTIYNAYPLPIPAKRMVKLCDKRLNPVVIWACEDGIIYAKANQLTGTVMWGCDAPLTECVDELMLYFDKQKGTKYVRY